MSYLLIGSKYLTMRLTLDALIVLESIDRKGSFAAAADELHRVRSALTYTVQTLERDLDITLFDRSGHRAKLTPIGKVLLQEGNDLLRSANDLERRIKRLKTGWEEEVFIVVNDIISIPKLYPLIEMYYQECTLTKLHLTAEILSGCWDALASGRADLAIGVSGDAPAGREFGMAKLGHIEFVFAVSPHHPLVTIHEPLKNADIIKYRAIIAGDTSRKLPVRSVGVFSGQENLIVSSIHAKIQAQVSGLGVGYLPLHLIQDEIRTKKLIIKQVEKVKSSANISIAWRINQAGKAVEWFIDKLKDPAIYKPMIS
jgi:DNA-binding transcriptional LysR family regulator